MSNAIDNLPPEMKARLAQIMASQQQAAAPEQQAAPQPQPAAQPQAPAAPPKPPSLMDHQIAARHEIAAARQEIAELKAALTAQGQVVEAVGNAVGQLYEMFLGQSQTSTYSEEFQAAPPSNVDDY